ncbi:hypothetical protein SLEP1_g12831 [Rubroshorea leprosula]|uniref:Protein kinase domain-containing protein n=1 Tax=Rubroshorea leprosula TaxID=152421 RepID=A0AAV5IJJ8_9ROSI|nr:hypothetical protein SLEP1_g12831 [Rubroshorea leprosula]
MTAISGNTRSSSSDQVSRRYPGFIGCMSMGSTFSTKPPKAQPSPPANHPIGGAGWANLSSKLELLMLVFFGPCKGGGSSEGSPDPEGITDHVQKEDGKERKTISGTVFRSAQEKGFLEFIINSKDNQHPSLLSPTSSPRHLPSTPFTHRHSDLAILIDQAKISGWYIDPQEIGQGSTVEIHRAIWRGLDVGVKCILPDFFNTNESGVGFFVQELRTLYRGCTDRVTGQNRGLTVPLPPFEERLARALEIAQGMQYLHEQKPKVIHRDLKPSNIFLDQGNHVRVADFGHPRFLNDEEKALTRETGTYVYMLPEVIRCKPYNEKCDVCSFNIILNEPITGDYPYLETDSGPTKVLNGFVEMSLS